MKQSKYSQLIKMLPAFEFFQNGQYLPRGLANRPMLQMQTGGLVKNIKVAYFVAKFHFLSKHNENVK